MSKDHQLKALTPCAGRCSTVFGDQVCRGCRRFNHEVIRWNNYTPEQQLAVWKRLDEQLDRILVPMLVHANVLQVEQFLDRKKVRLLPNATWGRKLYHALKLCEKNNRLADESGLGLKSLVVRETWDTFEARVLQLAEASYEFAWVRANSFGKNLIEMVEE
ncbi:DUF1289 domain-containing protein [Acinetobacter rathckeae]|uniref:DUF1289 domain-containing protein n=1 Tax=Acinetobacter rathckeae TaxID=2605272 RepID=UPI0018A3342D|nr:DUF1289 domain-containing protein [Acinetobacter rathckeae]MBF7686853.1 DUF1289 domain-containing protein [Acinetobacter rathckeae]MBF7695615.1 DUF1289 domain-containing protein [Acinetobacter rathckeae]